MHLIIQLTETSHNRINILSIYSEIQIIDTLNTSCDFYECDCLRFSETDQVATLDTRTKS